MLLPQHSAINFFTLDLRTLEWIPNESYSDPSVSSEYYEKLIIECQKNHAPSILPHINLVEQSEDLLLNKFQVIFLYQQKQSSYSYKYLIEKFNFIQTEDDHVLRYFCSNSPYILDCILGDNDNTIKKAVILSYIDSSCYVFQPSKIPYILPQFVLDDYLAVDFFYDFDYSYLSKNKLEFLEKQVSNFVKCNSSVFPDIMPLFTAADKDFNDIVSGFNKDSYERYKSAIKPLYVSNSSHNFFNIFSLIFSVLILLLVIFLKFFNINTFQSAGSDDIIQERSISIANSEKSSFHVLHTKNQLIDTNIKPTTISRLPDNDVKNMVPVDAAIRDNGTVDNSINNRVKDFDNRDNSKLFLNIYDDNFASLANNNHNSLDDCTTSDECNTFGHIYRTGNGVKVDYLQAKAYFQKSCYLGNLMACKNIKLLPINTSSSHQNARLVPDFYHIVEKCETGDECNTLGYIYKTGNGVKVDNYIAGEYFRKSCDMGNLSGCANSLHVFRDRYQLAEQCFTGEECNIIGHIYKVGYGVKSDFFTAKEYFRKSCDLLYGYGCYNLGRLYKDGYIENADPRVVQNYFNRASALGVEILY